MNKCIALRQVLKTNSRLTHLELQANEIGGLGGTLVAAALGTTQCALVRLDLSDNDVACEGVSMHLRIPYSASSIHLLFPFEWWPIVHNIELVP